MRSRVISILVLCGVALAAPGRANKDKQVEKLPPGKNVLWTDPGDVSTLDFAHGKGGVDGEPQPPFTFLKEDLGGTTPKVTVKDAADATWNVKFGDEASPQVFCNRLVWACGYVVETEYYLANGQITGARKLKRAKSMIGKDGGFSGARFQLRSDSPKFIKAANWSWKDNLFLGTRQLNGLKILMMLVSNWDAKDTRDIDPTGKSASADTNLGIFQETSDEGIRYLFFVDDWGASMGRWGHSPARSKWDCESYRGQTSDFVRGVHNDVVEWGYTGKHDHDITQGIRVGDVAWLLQYLGQITDDQLRAGLASAGATPEQVECFGSAIRDRIGQLRRIAASE